MSLLSEYGLLYASSDILTVDNSVHITTADQAYLTGPNFLDVRANSLAVVSPEVTLTQITVTELVVHNAYSSVIDGGPIATVHLAGFFSTLQEDGVSNPVLPALLCEAKVGERINLTGTLPGISLTDARFGLVVTGDLPALGCSGTILSGSVGTLDKNLPSLECSGVFGIRAGTLKLPTIESEITISGDSLGILNKTLPGLVLSATGSATAGAVLDKNLPPLSADITISWTTSASLDKNIPPPLLTGTILCGATGTLSENLPALKAEIEILYGQSLTINADLPTLVAGTIMGAISSASEVSRFTNYVLRHAR